MNKIKLLFYILMFIPSIALAAMPVNPSYVSPTGSGSTCTTDSPCALSYANTNADDDDVVTLKEGTYNTEISPVNSGSSGHVITFKADTGKTVTITQTGQYNVGIFLDGKDYIKIDGIKFTDVWRLANIRNGSDYNEITNCSFDGTTSYSSTYSQFMIWGQCAGGSPYTCYSTHNWVHGNTFFKSGEIGSDCDDGGNNIYLGTASGDYLSNNTTFEDNTVYAGAHALIETYTKYNVIRNNFFHNEGWMTDPGTCGVWTPSARNSKYGNRNVQLYQGSDDSYVYNVFEGNRVSNAAPSPDGGQEGNLTITSKGNIVRYNDSFYSETFGIAFKMGGSSSGLDNRVYNNSFYKNGYDSQLMGGTYDWRSSVGCHPSSNNTNILKNNVLYQGYHGEFNTTSNYNCTGRITSVNNFCTTGETGCTVTGNPLYTDTDVSDPTSTTKPDLTLQATSTAINAGTYLTLANGASDGASDTSLVVDDALYFQDGTWGSSLSTVAADYIIIGDPTTATPVQISSINYSTNTITLASARTWVDDAPVYLYKKSDGVQVLYGALPDIGAHESNTEGEAPPLTVTVSTVGSVCTADKSGSYEVNTGDILNVGYTQNGNYTAPSWSGTCPATGTTTRTCTPDADNQTVILTCGSKIAAEGKVGTGAGAKIGTGAKHKRY